MKLKLVCTLLFVNLSIVYSQFGGGTGTEGSPFIISTASHLADLSTNVNNGTNYSDVYFWQTEDIDLSGFSNWTPIGNYTDGTTNNPFSGRYGAESGKSITGLTINSGTNFKGLFGYTLNANLQNIVLETVSIIGGASTGALVGWADGTYIEYCSSSGTISGTNYVGGLIGGLDGLTGASSNSYVKNSNSTSSISGTNYVGGLIGWIYQKYEVDNCNASGDVSGTGNNIGGLVGSSEQGSTISNSYASGSVTKTGSGNSSGGLVGYNSQSIISTSYSTGSVNSSSFSTGGLVGQNDQSGNINNSYATGSVTCSNGNTGGLVGYNYQSSTITSCYAIGGDVSGSQWVGGLIGMNRTSSIVEKSYSTKTVSGTNYLGGLAGASIDLSQINNCYSRGNVTRTSGTNILIGSFIGNNTATVSNSYSTGKVYESTGTIWNIGEVKDKGFQGNSGGTTSNNFFDTNTSEQTTGYGATEKTTVQMKTNTTFLDAGWDAAIWNIGDGINDGYPYLDWQNTGGTPLPVELTTFSAKYVDGKIVLTWQTSTEVSNYGFRVERASTQLGMTWKEVSFVQGHGNSNSPKSYSYLDPNPPNGKVQYRLKQIDFDGKYEYSEIVEVNVEAPIHFSLQQNYPNPFNPETCISYKVQAASQVSLKVFDVLGREVTILVNEFKQTGNYNATFNAKTLRATSLPSGIYFYMLKAGNFTSTKKMILLR